MATSQLLTCVTVACDYALLGQPELIVLVQDYLLPLAEIDPAVALKIGGKRLLNLWLESAVLHGSSVEEYSGAAIFASIEKHGASFLNKAVNADVDPAVWTSVANYAVSSQALTVLQLLHDRVPNLQAANAQEIAARMSDLELLQWLHFHQFGGSQWTLTTVKQAARAGNQDMVDFLMETNQKQSDPRKQKSRQAMFMYAMDGAAMGGHLGMLQSLYSNAGTSRWSPHTLSTALHQGHYETASWIHEKSWTRTDLSMAICDAFDKGDLQKLDWLRERKLLKLMVKYVDRAKVNGHVHVLEYLAQFYPEQMNDFAFFHPACAKGGSIDVAKWAHSRQLLAKSIAVIYEAATYGHLAFIQWYVATMEGKDYIPLYEPPSMAPLAAEGYLECLQWMVENDYGAMTTDVLDTAAVNGHLDIVQWIASYPGTSLQVSANKVPAILHRGHLKMIQWLDAKGVSFGASPMVTAATYGHRELVQWLHKRERGTNKKTTIVEVTVACTVAAQKGHLRIVRYLLPYLDSSKIPHVLLHARTGGYANVAKWIEAYAYRHQVLVRSLPLETEVVGFGNRVQ